MQIRKLQVEGLGGEPAVMDFTAGLNVISGASNTGKSYIFQCIDYMLGGEKMAKAIDEAKLYTKMALELSNNHGEMLRLERAISGGDIRIVRLNAMNVATSDQTVLWKRDNSTRLDISSVLFEFCGIPKAVVRTNERGKTARLSFRMIAPLFLVSENDIIAEEPPLHNVGYDPTAEPLVVMSVPLVEVIQGPS